MGKKKKDYCASEKIDIAKRNAEQVSSGWNPVQVCKDCILHRWITPALFDEQSKSILPQAVVDARLSVIAECNTCSFGRINLRQAHEQATKEQGLEILGSICLPASFFIGTWEILHDPFPYTIRGESKNAHPNHVQVICEKGFEVYEKLTPLEWHVKPGDDFPELEMQQQSGKSDARKATSVIVALVLVASFVIWVLCSRTKRINK